MTTCTDTDVISPDITPREYYEAAVAIAHDPAAGPLRRKEARRIARQWLRILHAQRQRALAA